MRLTRFVHAVRTSLWLVPLGCACWPAPARPWNAAVGTGRGYRLIPRA